MRKNAKLFIFLSAIIIAGIFLFKPIKARLADLFPDQASKEERQYIGTVSGGNPRVKEVQNMLRELKFYAGPIDSKMGKETRNALVAFQKKSNIKATGKVDEKTLNELRKQSSGWLKDGKRPTKKKSTTGNRVNYDIKTIQSLLKDTGFYYGEVDGKMGPMTIKAIKQFQRSKNLKASGVMNVKTWEELKKFETGR